MAKKSTILDIAHLAGVSPATVSRVINRRPDVDKQTRERVLRIIAEKGYVPSINAAGARGWAQPSDWHALAALHLAYPCRSRARHQ